MVDSNFFFDTNVAKSLLQYYRNVKPLRCEIDAYGDFMQVRAAKLPGPHTLLTLCACGAACAVCVRVCVCAMC